MVKMFIMVRPFIVIACIALLMGGAQFFFTGGMGLNQYRIEPSTIADRAWISFLLAGCSIAGFLVLYKTE
jgi:hypothetical protein